MRLSFLEPLFDRPGPWATVYFDPGDNDEAGAKRRELAVREAGRQLRDQGADPATVEALEAVLAEVHPAEDPAGRVAFAADGEVALTHRLARRPQPQIAEWAPLPRLTPLLELAGQDPRCLVAYIDRTGADFELVTSAGRRQAGQAEGQQWPVNRTATADPSERRFQEKVENTWEENAAMIAEALTSAYEGSDAEVAVLSGDPRQRTAVYDRLPVAIQESAVLTERGGRAEGSESAALEAVIAGAREERVRLRTEESQERFRAGRIGTGRPTEAVEGVPAVVAAAREHRVETLLLRTDGPDLDRETWVGPAPDQLAVRRTEAQTLGAPDPAAARADDALLRSAAVTAADVLVVHPDGEESDLPVGGIGALLRWPVEEPEAG